MKSHYEIVSEVFGVSSIPNESYVIGFFKENPERTVYQDTFKRVHFKTNQAAAEYINEMLGKTTAIPVKRVVKVTGGLSDSYMTEYGIKIFHNGYGAHMPHMLTDTRGVDFVTIL